MTSFWVVAGVFIVGALMFVLPTLWSKRNRDGGVARDATNIDVYRDQLDELDNDLRSDILTREQYEQSKRDLLGGAIALLVYLRQRRKQIQEPQLSDQELKHTEDLLKERKGNNA